MNAIFPRAARGERPSSSWFPLHNTSSHRCNASTSFKEHSVALFFSGLWTVSSTQRDCEPKRPSASDACSREGSTGAKIALLSLFLSLNAPIVGPMASDSIANDICTMLTKDELRY